MDKSFFNEVENEEFKKQIREDIVKCLDDERKINTNLNKKLYELEMHMLLILMKDIDSYFVRNSEIATKLQDFTRLYSYLMDIDRKMEFVKIGCKKYIEYKSK